MLNEETFLKLIKDHGGFQVTLGFRDDVDHFIGGTGNKYWYFVKKGTKEEFYVCTYAKEGQTDVHFTRKKKILTGEPAQAGKTMALILSDITVGQEEIEKSGRKPIHTEVYGHPCSHYVFSFGERAYKIADEYGVTVEYSNLKDEPSGFRLRDIMTGEDVKAPKEE